MLSLFSRNSSRRHLFNLCLLVSIFLIISYSLDFYPRFSTPSSTIGLLQPNRNDASPTSASVFAPPIIPTPALPQVTFEDLENGRWRPRNPPYTSQDLLSLWRGEYSSVQNLPPIPEGQSRSPEEEAAQKADRALAIANWVWEGVGTAEEWSWQEWVKLLLRSNGGLIIIGDSIQLQLFDYLRRCLSSDLRFDLNFTTIHGFPPEHRAPSVYSVSASPGSPVGESLLALAGPDVPRERLTRPLLSYVRSDVLVDVETLIKYRDEVVKGSDWTPPTDGDYQTDSGLNNIVFGDWESYTRELSKVYRLGRDATTGIEQTWSGQEKTIIHVNTGAHWSSGTIRGLTEDQVKSIYTKMVDYVYPIIKSIPRTRLIYRPSVAGHVDCETYAAPVSRMEDLKPITFWGNWAWSLFGWYNEVWKDVMDQDNVTPSGLSGMLPVHFRTRLRPDHHFLRGDCLHMEGPTVVGDWAAWTWKMLGYLEPGWRRSSKDVTD